MLLGLHFQHELRQRAVQARHGALHDAEARASEFDAHVKVQAQRRAHVYMVFDRKVKYPRCAPAAGHHIAVLVCPARHAGVRQIGHGQQHGLHITLDPLQLRGAVFQFGFDVGGLRHHGVHFCGTRSAFGLELADLLAQRVAPGLQFFGAGLDGFALGFQRGEGGQVQKGLRRFTGIQAGKDRVQVFAQQIDIKHGGSGSFQGVGLQAFGEGKFGVFLHTV